MATTPTGDGHIVFGDTRIPCQIKPAPLSPHLHIRWMIRADMAEVLAIESASFPHPWNEEDFIRVLRQRNAIGVVVEHTGSERVLGYTIYELQRGSLRLLNFAVHPDFRRRGVGAALLAKLRSKLSSERRNKIIAEISEDNLPAHKFFAASGFRATAVCRNFYANHDGDAYRFVFRHPAG